MYHRQLLLVVAMTAVSFSACGAIRFTGRAGAQSSDTECCACSVNNDGTFTVSRGGPMAPSRPQSGGGGIAFLAAQHHQRQSSPLRCGPRAAQLAEKSYFSYPQVIESVLQGILELQPEGTWLQIGANTLDPNGDAIGIEDPLLAWLPNFTEYRKIFVEPIPDLFAALNKNIHKLRLKHFETVNVAILAEEGPEKQIDMFCAPEELWSEARLGGCSFSSDKVKMEVNGQQPRKFEVTGISVARLFEKQKITDVNILLIDAEGFDDKIILQLPFDSAQFRPSLIIFEIIFLKGKRLDYLIEFLHSHCYMLVQDGMNAFAVPMLF